MALRSVVLPLLCLLLPTRSALADPDWVQEISRSADAEDGDVLTQRLPHDMAARLGVDLGRVRLHVGYAAAGAARALGARAFTLGEDIFLAQGTFAADDTTDQALIAHELVHVAQAQPACSRRAGIGAEYVPVPAPVWGDDSAAEAEAEAVRLAARVVAGERVRVAVHVTCNAIQRLPDKPGQIPSATTMAYLERLERVERFPLLSVLRASPTLRLYDVEQAARSRRLTRFDEQPGSTFLGAIGEALVWRSIEYQSGGYARAATQVFPQPVTFAAGSARLPEALRSLLARLGRQEPDLLVILPGAELPVGGVRIVQSPRLHDVISPSTDGRVGEHVFTGRSVIGLYEVTTSTRWDYVKERGIRVAEMAQVFRSLRPNPDMEIIVVLAMDRATYFNLAESDRTRLVSTVTGAGGFIALFRDLTRLSIMDARQIEQDLALQKK